MPAPTLRLPSAVTVAGAVRAGVFWLTARMDWKQQGDPGQYGSCRWREKEGDGGMMRMEYDCDDLPMNSSFSLTVDLHGS